jgi:hypothetical protein
MTKEERINARFASASFGTARAEVAGGNGMRNVPNVWR